MTNENPKSSGDVSKNVLWSESVSELLTDLLYPSESDEAIEVIACYLNQPGPLTVSQVKDWLMLPPTVCVEEMEEANFWEPVIIEQDWYEEEEKERTTKFQKLKQVLESTLTVRQVFRVGETEIDVYLVGLQADGQRGGIKTKIVQT